ncbi:hypothetical protein PV328_008672 [Microctonus aethiopoides]|uniref:BRCT domain-containing protein n=1 Tax=Microctonus aethiopoides TaxID=144406 RepID=A0AA39FK37_9HYME|nr:hypothetical protein PV328_008672 [Microctonus aethiopoides]
MTPPINTSTRQILTPKRTLTPTPGLDTPIINERLSLAQNTSINSPFHISTPDTPYGQIFKPNPSPHTRKLWAQLIDDLPGKDELSPAQIWFPKKKPSGGAVNQQGRSTMDDHDELSVNKDDGMETPINRVLAFTEDEESRSKKMRSMNSMNKRIKFFGPRVHQKRVVRCLEKRKRLMKNHGIILCQRLSRKDRSNNEEIIKHLGGEVSQDATFDATATHLLCVKPSRNEKMLDSIAAGKRILHCSYLRDCERAAAANRWRVKLQGTGKCAFNGMVAMLMMPNEKHDQLARLIEAGGGTVVQAKPPYDTSPNGKKVTQCFIQINKLEQPVDWAMLASKGI